MLYAPNTRISARRMFLIFTDIVLILASIALSAFIRLSPGAAWYYIANNVFFLFLSVIAFQIVFFAAGMYERHVLVGHAFTLRLPFISTVIGFVIIIVMSYAFNEQKIGRGVMLVSSLFIVWGTWFNRFLYRLAVGRGFLAKRTLIVGSGEECRSVIDLLNRTPGSGYRIYGLIGCSECTPGELFCGVPVLGLMSKFEEFVNVYDVECVIVAAPRDEERQLWKELRHIRYRGVELIDYVGLREELAQEISLDHVDDEWLMYAALNSSRIHIRTVKRLLDISVSILGLVLGAPIMGIAALLIKMDSRGPMLYQQARLGVKGKTYTLYKLRTMRTNAESDTGAIWAGTVDHRVTRVGKYLRRWRIDEIPQLFNVLKGDMSLVGPRPERPEFFQMLMNAIPLYEERLLVSPGITGWAQVRYPYAASIEASKRKLQFDLYYIKHMSLALDLTILLKTFKTIFVGLRYSEDAGLELEPEGELLIHHAVSSDRKRTPVR